MSIKLVTPVAVCLLAVLAGLWYWQRHNLFFRLIFCLSLLGFLSEFLSVACILGYISFGKPGYNVPVYNVYMLLEVWVIALAVGSLFQSRKLLWIIAYCLLGLSAIWGYCIAEKGWYYMATWFYLAGSIFVTGLLLYVVKKNLETYFLSDQLPSYLLVIFGQLLFCGAAFEALALRYLILEIGKGFSRKIDYVVFVAMHIRMLFFLAAFLLLRKKSGVTVQASLS